jgi:hypothetical protein
LAERSRVRRLGAATPLALLFVAAVTDCVVSVGQGTGNVESGHLLAKACWDDAYDLQPDFFSADPFRNQMHIRVQRGDDLIEVSDGVSILIDDIDHVRAHLGEPLPVLLPRGVSPPGVPEGSLCGELECAESKVHIALYLLKSCHNQNIVLYATEGTITFDEVFSGDPNEEEAAEKLTQARFDVMVGDPRDMVLSGPDAGRIPDQSNITGDFEFYFQRGQPAQPFP